MPEISVIMPVYNVERFVRDAVASVLAQSFRDFELLIVDDRSPDRSIAICETIDDPRIRIIRHRENRGLAGARNTGIRHARGELLAFIDSDDCWHPDKLALHARHLSMRPKVGISFSRSAFIDAHGRPTHCYQMPRLTGIDAGYCLCRNPIGNGSAPVIRKAVFDAIRHRDLGRGNGEDWYFDERLRRSEDIECWIRIALTTDWQIEGIPQALTLYRLNAGGLSANLAKQLASWEEMIEKTRRYAPDFVARWEHPARAYQLRYLARQAIRLQDGATAARLARQALATYPRIALHEPARTLITLGAAYTLCGVPRWMYPWFESTAQRAIGSVQSWRISRDLQSLET